MLFTDKYNPKKLEEFILPSRIIKQFKDGLYSHHLFHSNPGMGKSALAKLLSSQYPFRKWNASLEGRIDVLREEIDQYCAGVQLNDEGKRTDFKVVFLDEIDGVSLAFWDALRGFMDTYGKSVRFIATCNYLHKVPAPMTSRFELCDFGFVDSTEEAYVKRGYTARLKAIVEKALKIEIQPDALAALVDNNFPDFRDGLQVLQRLYQSGTKLITVDDVKAKSYEMKELYDLILAGRMDEPEKIHSLLMGDYATRAHEVLQSLDTNFVDYICINKPDYKSIIPNTLIRVCHYQSTLPIVIDPALAMKACIFELVESVARINLTKAN